jgi:anion-transporting  ArsA/GET3 family ATPase
MNLEQFCSASRIVVVAGKGGVGKTTVTAALATVAARAGLRVLIVEVEGKSGLAAAFGCLPLTYEEQTVRDGLRVRTLTPDEALREYLEDRGLHRISRRLMKSGALDVVATAVPGMKDILVLGKVKQLERAEAADLIIVDAPATGHAFTFLTSASGLLDAARGGPVRTQASEVLELLSDPDRCRVMLVTLAEEMPVSETVEAAYRLEDQAGVQLGPVIVNSVEAADPALATPAVQAAFEAGVELADADLAALDAAREFALRRHTLQATQIERLAGELPLPQLHMPALATVSIGLPELDRLASALEEAISALGEETSWR